MIAKKSALVLIVGAFIEGVGVAVLAFLIYQGLTGESGYQISELTTTERDNDLMEKMPPMQIVVEVVTAAEFDRRKPLPNAIAWAEIWRHPCHVVVPEGYLIVARPRSRLAFFSNDEVSRTLAHEFLHCIRGQWHPAWPK